MSYGELYNPSQANAILVYEEIVNLFYDKYLGYKILAASICTNSSSSRGSTFVHV